MIRTPVFTNVSIWKYVIITYAVPFLLSKIFLTSENKAFDMHCETKLGSTTRSLTLSFFYLAIRYCEEIETTMGVALPSTQPKISILSVLTFAPTMLKLYGLKNLKGCFLGLFTDCQIQTPQLLRTVRKKCLIDKQTKVTVLLGDFNLDHIPPNVTTKHFQRITNLYNLRQLIIEPTRITHHSKTLIELLFTSKPEFYVSGVSPIGFYHQLAIFGTRKRHKISLRHSFLSKIYS